MTMDYSKSKLQIGSKTPKAKLGGASTSSANSSSSPLQPKKDYKKNSAAGSPVDFGMPNFGQTGLTGES